MIKKEHERRVEMEGLRTFAGMHFFLGRETCQSFSRKPFIWAALLTLGLAGAAPAVGGTDYTILNLGTLGGTYSAAYGLNDSGQVVGYSYPAGDNLRYHAFRTVANSPITAASDLGTIGTDDDSYGAAINASGQVTGGSFPSDFSISRAYRTTPGGSVSATTSLGSFGGTQTDGYAINNLGQVVGHSYGSGNGGDHAFRTTATGGITPASDLGTLGGSLSVALGINESAQVVGASSLPEDDFAHHAFRTASGGVITPATDLGTLGGDNSQANAINESGQTVGSAFIAGSAISHAFRTTATGGIDAASDLGSFGGNECQALAINDAGQTVGYGRLVGDAVQHAFFVDVTGPMIDLNTLLPAGSGWELVTAYGINNAGQICGEGLIGGETHAFLLTPTPAPEPGALVLLTAGGAGLRRSRRVLRTFRNS
jgi:probable HAF family extracellular repeat protein